MSVQPDRELLELAAKAAGIEVVRSRLDDPAMRDMVIHTPKDSEKREEQRIVGWNPLTNDGDALRLAVTLKINILHMSHLCRDYWIEAGIGNSWLAQESVAGSDIHTATRRAIVRAAAEIGKAMP